MIRTANDGGSRSVWLVALATFLVGGCATSTTTIGRQSRIEPFRNGLRNGLLIPTGRDSLTITLVRGTDSINVGWATDEIRLEERDGRRVLVREQESESTVYGHSIQRTVDDAPGLSPVSHAYSGRNRSYNLTFSRAAVTGWIQYSDRPERDTVTIASGHFGFVNASNIDLLVQTMPLNPGFQFAMQGFSGADGEMVLVSARVIGQLFEPGNNEAIALIEADRGGTRMTFLIGQTTRRLLGKWIELPMGKLVYRVVPNKEG